MNDKQAFEDAIKADRYNQALRWAYSDWLEQNGSDDEALAQREWTKEWQESRDWLENFASRLSLKEAYKLNPEDCEEGDLKPQYTYEELMSAMRDYLAGEGESRYGVYLPFDIPNFVYQEKEEFWRYFDKVTKSKTSENQRRRTPFSCSC